MAAVSFDTDFVQGHTDGYKVLDEFQDLHDIVEIEYLSIPENVQYQAVEFSHNAV